MSHYVGTKSSCEDYDVKVSNQLGFTGSITARWSDVNRHPAKSLFRVAAHASIRSEERRVGKECRSRGSPDH